jgi:hypothetical protein
VGHHYITTLYRGTVQNPLYFFNSAKSPEFFVLRKTYLRLWVVVKMVTQQNIKKKVGKKFPFLNIRSNARINNAIKFVCISECLRFIEELAFSPL